MSGENALQCPVCRARFRETPECARCGADLAPLMLLAGKAYRLRQEAREALRGADPERARRLAAEAQDVWATPAGRRLCKLVSVLSTR